MIVEVDPRAIAPRSLRPPISKSDALRALAVAHLYGVPPHPLGSPDELPEDVARFIRGLEVLRTGSPEAIDCGDGGAPFRFLLALAAAVLGGNTPVVLTGSERLGARPRDALIEALREGLGCSIAAGSPWPVRVVPASVPPADRCIRVEAHQSSQFASAALFAAAAASRRDRRPWTVELRGPVASAAYLELTRQWLVVAGARLTEAGPRLEVDATNTPPSALPGIPRDWSSAAYLLLIGWRLNLAVDDLSWNAAHPDRAIVEHLERAKAHPERGIDADVRGAPDLAPTLAALACVLRAPSVLRHVAILRDKESDRVEGIRALVTCFGADCELIDNDQSLRISPPARLPARVRFDARGDHRFALSATTLAILTGTPLTLEGAEVVKKSFPGFFAQLGLTLEDAASSAARAAATRP